MKVGVIAVGRSEGQELGLIVTGLVGGVRAIAATGGAYAHNGPTSFKNRPNCIFVGVVPNRES